MWKNMNKPDFGVLDGLKVVPSATNMAGPMGATMLADHGADLIWLENLNLRGTFKPRITAYIAEKYPHLVPLYRDIYVCGRLDYWRRLDEEIRAYASSLGLEYAVNDDTMSRPFGAPPVIVNYFYHSEIKRSANKDARRGQKEYGNIT